MLRMPGQDRGAASETDSDTAASPHHQEPLAAETHASFAEVYDLYFEFVWRIARRLGVRPAALDDVVQETFMVVHRRLAEPRSSTLRTWIYGVTVHMVRNHRRSVRRKSPHRDGCRTSDLETVADNSDGPERVAQKAEAARTLYGILRDLDDDKREVFVSSSSSSFPRRSSPRWSVFP